MMLKNEMYYRQRFATRRRARFRVMPYIEVFYNRKRPHSTLGYRTPAEARAGYYSQIATAAGDPQRDRLRNLTQPTLPFKLAFLTAAPGRGWTSPCATFARRMRPAPVRNRCGGLRWSMNRRNDSNTSNLTSKVASRGRPGGHLKSTQAHQPNYHMDWTDL